jgi:hypothetical protein
VRAMQITGMINADVDIRTVIDTAFLPDDLKTVK